MSKLQEKPSAFRREHSALQDKFLNFFPFLWVIFALLDPDPDPLTLLNPDTALKHCSNLNNIFIYRIGTFSSLLVQVFVFSVNFLCYVFSICDNGDVLHGERPGHVQLPGAPSHALLLTPPPCTQVGNQSTD